MTPKIFVALDYSSAKAAEELVEQLNPNECGLKVGKQLFTAQGPHFIKNLVARGFKVFLDLKFHDIPNTVANACLSAADLGVWMINVHCLGGNKMLEESAKAIQSYGASAPKLIGVTLLTSLGATDLTPLGIHMSPEKLVLQLTQLAFNAGLDGIVSSAQEVASLRQRFPKPFLFVTPGIRLNETSDDDQKRIMTPVKALQAGSDILVIGRPITQAKAPQQVISQVLDTQLRIA